jgi:NAD(P)-dependent dehydrogenase (short-subunit alcohol dehydrogenase family)
MDDLADTIAAVSPEVREHFGLGQLPTGEPRSLSSLLDLTGRRVLVTGGGGTDLGSALCRRLADQGATVGVLDIDRPRAHQVADALDGAMALVADVADWDAVHAAVDEFADRVGGIDILVNNAGGGFGTHGSFATRSKADIDVVVATNLVGVLYATHSALRHMREQRSGRVITIASEGGRIAMRNLAAYNTCKAGVIAFMRNLAREVGPEGISTVTVCPGALLAPKLLDRLATWPSDLASVIDRASPAPARALRPARRGRGGRCHAGLRRSGLRQRHRDQCGWRPVGVSDIEQRPRALEDERGRRAHDETDFLELSSDGPHHRRALQPAVPPTFADDQTPDRATELADWLYAEDDTLKVTSAQIAERLLARSVRWTARRHPLGVGCPLRGHSHDTRIASRPGFKLRVLL